MEYAKCIDQNDLFNVIKNTVINSDTEYNDKKMYINLLKLSKKMFKDIESTTQNIKNRSNLTYPNNNKIQDDDIYTLLNTTQEVPDPNLIFKKEIQDCINAIIQNKTHHEDKFEILKHIINFN